MAALLNHQVIPSIAQNPGRGNPGKYEADSYLQH